MPTLQEEKERLAKLTPEQKPIPGRDTQRPPRRPTAEEKDQGESVVENDDV